MKGLGRKRQGKTRSERGSPRFKLPPGSVWVSVKLFATVVLVFMLGSQYQAAVATGEVHQTAPIIIGTLKMCAAVAMLVWAVRFVLRDFASEPKKNISLRALGVLAVSAVVLSVFGYHYAKPKPVNGWTPQTVYAGVSAGLAIAVMLLFLWSLFRTKQPRGGRIAAAMSAGPPEEDPHFADHPTEGLSSIGFG